MITWIKCFNKVLNINDYYDFMGLSFNKGLNDQWKL
jgi:hypothetical protein